MVTRAGYRAFYVIYKPRGGGKPRAYRIGPADDLSYKEARTKAETIRGLVADGKDPVGDEQAARERKRSTRVVSVRDAFDYYLEAHRTKLDRKTVQAHEQTRDSLPNPLLQAPAENVTPSLFRQHIKAATQAPVMQNRHLGRLKAVLRFAHVEDYIKTLPSVVGMRKPHAETKRKRVLNAEEIRAAWEAVDAIAPIMPRGGRAFVASVRLQLLCGTRLGETCLATWGEFDLDGTSPRSETVPEDQPMWYIPADHRKGERGKKRPHWIPLSPLAVSVLRELQPITGDKPVVFFKAGYDARTYMLGKLLAEMRRRGLGEPWSFHDLRRTCSTALGEMGCPDELNDLILGHVKRGVLSHYNHAERLQERADWMQRWADRVADIVGLRAAPQAGVAPRLHLYLRPDGLPEMTAAKEPANGRRYLGAFTPTEAARKAEEMARRLVAPTARAR